MQSAHIRMALRLATLYIGTMRFSPAFLDEIRDRVPISSVIGSRVTWDRRKTNASRGDWWACCPFHGEKSPSFHCEDRKARYHCFGCGVTGDHFSFLTELEGMSFPEAVEKIADMAGVPMPARDAREEKRERERASLHEVMELATSFFEERLQSADGARARAYLRERGLTPATQKAFRLGFAPESRNALKEHLAGKSVSKEQIEACGLVRHGDDIPVSYDYFRDRIMFPIPDSRGRIIAFGGRAMAADALAKYMNSPETELFRKGNVLYNFARARKSLPNGGSVIQVEGYMDVIALAQAGFENAVAPLGTALTENQLELLWRMSPEPILCFDGDKAGLKAAWRAADLALPAIQPGRSVRFALMPEGQDPDDLVKAEGADGFRRVLADARPLADLIWMRETAGGVFDTPERRAELEKTLRELTGRIRDESVRFHYQQEMRERVRQALDKRTAVSQPTIDVLETDLHILCLEPVRNRRLADAARLAQLSLVVNRLFGTYIGVHDESEMLMEHRLVLDHLILGDGAGTETALRYHLDADHQRARARLKVLSVFSAPEIAPYLIRVH